MIWHNTIIYYIHIHVAYEYEYVCMYVCMYIYDTGSLHKTPMRRYELAKIRIVTRICMYVYVRWYKCIDIQNSQLQHLYMCRSIYFRRAAVGVDRSFGLAKSQTPWLGPSLSWWMKMVSWCDQSDVSGEGCPKVGWQELTHIHTWPHTHNNHETWFAYSQQAPMLTTWIDTILDSFIFALTRGSTVDEASRQVVLTELDVRQYSAETTNGWIHQKVIHVALVAQGSSSWLTNSHIVKTKSLARWRLLHWTHCSLLSDRSRLSLGPLNLVALQEALSMDDCPALLNLLSRLLVALAGKRRKLINL